MPPKNGRPNPGSSITSFIIPRFSCCSAAPSRACPISQHSLSLKRQPSGFVFLFRAVSLARAVWAILVPLLAFPPVLWTFGLGQNGFLTAGLFGAATLLIDRRPAVAGLLFGALCIKPHYALLVPVALAASGRWRAFAAAFACAAILCLSSLVVFGWPTWHAFLTAVTGSQAVYASGRIPFGGYVTPFGAAMLLGATGRPRRVQVGATLAAAGFVAGVWRRGLPLPIRAASLASATLVAVPLALFYDLVLGGDCRCLAAARRREISSARMGRFVARRALCFEPQPARDQRCLASAVRLVDRAGVRGAGRHDRVSRQIGLRKPNHRPAIDAATARQPLYPSNARGIDLVEIMIEVRH